MADLPFTALQAVAFGGPVVLTMLVWWFGVLSGRKTTINASLGSFTAGMELIDFGWMAADFSSALIAGFAVSTLVSNTVLTARE